MKFDNIVIDASSLLNFVRYYHEYFRHYNVSLRKPEFQTIFSGLKKFLVSKIESGEIIVLDKVYDELRTSDMNELKEDIKESVVKSIIVFNDVENLIDKYTIIENYKLYNDDKDKINAELELYETKYADLFIIAYANKLKTEGKNILIITEERFTKDGKLIPKIPEICKHDNENIQCRNMPYALFDFYKDELTFSLDIIDN